MRRIARYGLAASAAFLVLPASADAARPIAVRSASSPLDKVSGGDIRVIVDVRGPVTLRVNGRTRTLTPVEGPRGASILIDGLRHGRNEAVLSARGRADTRLVIVDHPASGPILSGPQLTPWICARTEARPATPTTAAVEASGLAADPVDAGCGAPPTYRLFYRTTARDCRERADAATPCFRPYDPRAARPADMATIAVGSGSARDYVVRVERGAINRGLYDLAVLFDPRAAAPAALSRWNGKMVWFFGGSGGNQRRQTPPQSSWMNDDALRHGFLVGVSNLTDGSRNNNRVLAAETVMMMREHVSDRYGTVRHLIGEGCSAGSMQQMVIATMYPGLIDGSLIACSFPDSDSLSLEITDAFLLGRYFNGASFRELNRARSSAQLTAIRAAIAGHKDDGTTEGWARFLPGYLPGLTGTAPSSNGCQLPNALIWDAVRHPRGIRCASPDLSVNIWGTVAGSVAARQFRDNVGVQYGLGALMSGAIDGEQFVRLNEGIGGFDHDGRFVARRVAGDPVAIERAYRFGLISDGRILADTPIIDLRGDENSGVHANWHSFALRERIRAGAGSLASHAMWRIGLPLNGAPWIDNPAWRASGLPLRSLLTMDRWLDALDRDTGHGTRAQKVARNRPSDLRSLCYRSGEDRPTLDEAACDRDPSLRYYTGTRQVAGAPFDASVLKCELRPVDDASYRGRLSMDQLARLRALFTEGVCDWRRRRERVSTGTWPTFEQ